MSLIAYAVLTLTAAGLAIALRSRPRWVTAVGLGGLGLAVALALALDPGETLVVGRTGLATSAYLRLFLVLGSLVGFGLALSGTAGGTRRDAPAVILAILGTAALTLGLAAPAAAIVVSTAGGLVAVLVTLAPGTGRLGAAIGIRETRAVVASGALAIVAVAWFGRDLDQFSGGTVVFGLAYLAVVVGIAMRFGAIPFHLWSARLTDVVPESALPVVTALGPASLAVVGLAWIESSVAPTGLDLGPERGVGIAIALASVVLASVAALVQDDIEHVLGYAIVADAGIVVLALATLDPGAWQPARVWILAFIVGRGALAAWTAAIRVGFFTGHVADLRGWARRSPILGLALVFVAVAGVGVPGLAAFDARTSLIDLVVAGPLAIVVRIAAFLPLLYYGRLLVVGVARPERSGAPIEPWRPRLDRPDLTAVRPWLARTWEVNRAFTTAVVALALGLLAVATAGGSFGAAVAAAEPAPRVTVPGNEIVPVPVSPGPSASPQGG